MTRAMGVCKARKRKHPQLGSCKQDAGTGVSYQFCNVLPTIHFTLQLPSVSFVPLPLDDLRSDRRASPCRDTATSDNEALNEGGRVRSKIFFGSGKRVMTPEIEQKMTIIDCFGVEGRGAGLPRAQKFLLPPFTKKMTKCSVLL